MGGENDDDPTFKMLVKNGAGWYLKKSNPPYPITTPWDHLARLSAWCARWSDSYGRVYLTITQMRMIKAL